MVEDTPPPDSNGAPPAESSAETLLAMFDRLRKSVPPEAWDDVPSDGSINYKHYLYAHPKVESW